jgi:hypothetical protein
LNEKRAIRIEKTKKFIVETLKGFVPELSQMVSSKISENSVAQSEI